MSLLTVFNECTTTPLTEYENSSAQQIMKNNQMFQRLGIGTLVSILKNPWPPMEDEGPEKSGFEYHPHANEGCEEKEEVSKVQILLHYTTMCIMSIISH
jgi:hypothetical protein